MLLKAKGKNPGAWQILICWKFYDFELCNKINAIWVYSTQAMGQNIWPKMKSRDHATGDDISWLQMPVDQIQLGKLHMPTVL